MTSLPIQFRDGRRATLVKHPRAVSLAPDAAAATPWGLRMVDPSTGKRGWHSLRTADPSEAKRRAKDLLDAAADGSAGWTSYAAFAGRRLGVTVGALAQEYVAAGCPRLGDAQPEPRTGRALEDERGFLDRALAWWGERPLASVTRTLIDDYAAHRQPHLRSAELELNALSNAVRYAIRRDRATTNPFAGRGRLRAAGSIVHCHTEAPTSPEELHAVTGWLLRQPHLASYGAALLWSAFTGLRPGEIGYLRADAQPGQPGALSTLTADGQTFTVMHVRREKRGINPAVRLHPAALEFLAAWSAVRPASSYHFPHPQDATRPVIPAGHAAGCALDKHLKRAAAACGVVGNRRPHAMRAYYVRVRRSQGALDSVIASELGERTGESLIVSTYGDPAGLRGDGKFTWLPATQPPAWAILAPAPNVIPLPAASPGDTLVIHQPVSNPA